MVKYWNKTFKKFGPFLPGPNMESRQVMDIKLRRGIWAVKHNTYFPKERYGNVDDSITINLVD